MQVITLSVYGSNPRYWRGAQANIELARVYYPGWQVWVYHEHGKRHHLKGADRLYNMGRSRVHSGMFWRFLAAWEEGVERVIVRDTDSRLNPREAAAVAAWIESGLDAHCMHDHPHHACLPLFGGMWGVRGGILSRDAYHRCRTLSKRPQPRVADMRFLRDHVLPRIQGSLLRHSSVPVKWPGAQPFPPHEPWKGFVGEQIK